MKERNWRKLQVPGSSCTSVSVNCKEDAGDGDEEDCKKGAGKLFEVGGAVEFSSLDEELIKMGINERVDILALMRSRHPPIEEDRDIWASTLTRMQAANVEWPESHDVVV